MQVKNKMLKQIYKNKKADLAVVLLVFLVVLLTLSSLFLFLTNSRVDSSSVDVSFLDGLLIREKKAEFYLDSFVEQAFVKTYAGFAANKKYMVNQKEKDGAVFFTDVLDDSKLNSKFKGEFDLNYKVLSQEREKQLSTEIGEDNLDNLKDYEISLGDKGAKIRFKNLVFYERQSSERDSGLIHAPPSEYVTDFNISVNFNGLGLHSFKEIYNAKEECKVKQGSEEKEKCFKEKLFNFNVEIIDKASQDYYLVSLSSKRLFLINNELKPVSFDFAQSL